MEKSPRASVHSGWDSFSGHSGMTCWGVGVVSGRRSRKGGMGTQKPFPSSASSTIGGCTIRSGARYSRPAILASRSSWRTLRNRSAAAAGWNSAKKWGISPDSPRRLAEPILAEALKAPLMTPLMLSLRASPSTGMRESQSFSISRFMVPGTSFTRSTNLSLSWVSLLPPPSSDPAATSASAPGATIWWRSVTIFPMSSNASSM